jgi:hypothetical protein
MALRIFISYARLDRDLAEDLRSRLEHVSDEVTLVSPESGPGHDWSAALLSELKKADEILVLLTPNSLQSANVLLAVGAGIGLQKKIIPIVVGLDGAALPGWVRETQFVRYSDLNTYLLDLVRKAGEDAPAVHGASAKAGVTS